MIEIAPGLWPGTARRESIGMDVSSYYLESERVLIDPMIPPGGLDWLELATLQRSRCAVVLLATSATLLKGGSCPFAAVNLSRA